MLLNASAYLVNHRFFPPPVFIGANVEILLCLLRCGHFAVCVCSIQSSGASEMLLSSRGLDAGTSYTLWSAPQSPQSAARLGSAKTTHTTPRRPLLDHLCTAPQLAPFR